MAFESYREYTDAVRAAADLAQVVGDVVSLRRAGRSLTGLCPFHQERSPSFHVDPQKGLYYCFGCGAGGDVFKFVQAVHGLDFTAAVDFLAERYGIPRPSLGRNREQEAQQTRHRDRILKALSSAHEWFVARLMSADGGAARAYLHARGLDEGVVRRLGLGFAGTGWDGLLRHLGGTHGYEPTELVDAGLVVPRREGSGYYDRFRGRLILPIRDSSGRLVSFAGRALDAEEPKYINGPESVVYDKGRTLYRLHEAAAAMRASGRVVVVEGYFDAISLALAGVNEVVAVCGTALGPEHAKLLRRWAPQVVLMLDSDAAGRRAIHRALPIVLGAGLSVKIASSGADKDPDELARSGGVSAVEAALTKAADLAEFLVLEARRQFDLSALDGRVAAMEMVLGQLSHLASPLARSEAASRVADGLGFDDGLIREELQRAAKRRQVALTTTALEPRQAAPLRPAEQELLRYLTTPRAEERDRLIAELTVLPPELLSPLMRRVLERLARSNVDQLDGGLRELTESLPDADQGPVLELAFVAGEEPSLDTAEAALVTLRREQLEARLKEIQARLQTLDRGAASDCDEEMDELLRKKQELGRQLHQLLNLPSRPKSSRSATTIGGRASSG